MRLLLLAAAISLALAGCQTAGETVSPAPSSNADQALRESLPKICAAAQTGHFLFVLAASFGKASPKAIATERAAWEALEPLCVNPEAETTGRALTAAWRAYKAIRATWTAS